MVGRSRRARRCVFRHARAAIRQRRRRGLCTPTPAEQHGGGSGPAPPIDADADTEPSTHLSDYTTRVTTSASRGTWLSTSQLVSLLCFSYSTSPDLVPFVAASSGHLPQVMSPTDLLLPVSFSRRTPYHDQSNDRWKGAICNTSSGAGLHWVNVLWRNDEAVVIDPTSLSDKSELVNSLHKLFSDVTVVMTDEQKDGWSCGYRAVSMSRWLFPVVNDGEMSSEDVVRRAREFDFIDGDIDEYLTALRCSLYGDTLVSLWIDTYRLSASASSFRNRIFEKLRTEDTDGVADLIGLLSSQMVVTEVTLDEILTASVADTTPTDQDMDEVLNEDDDVFPQPPDSPSSPISFPSPQDDAPATVVSDESLVDFLDREKKNVVKVNGDEGGRFQYSVWYKQALATLSRRPSYSVRGLARSYVVGSTDEKCKTKTLGRWVKSYPDDLSSIPGQKKKG